MTELSPAPEPVTPSPRRRGLIIGAVVVLAAAAIPVVAALSNDDGNDKGPVVHGDAIAEVRAAVGTTLAAGSYDMDFNLQSTPATETPQSQSQVCNPPPTLPPGMERAAVLCIERSPRSSSGFQSSGHATINADPYAMAVTSNTSAGNGLTLFVNTTTVWQGPSASPLNRSTGIPLSRFASTVEGTLGPAQGAIAMFGLASQGGYLNLEQAAVANATPAGTGSVDGTPVSYYDVTLDLTKLVDAPNLTDEERTTMEAALPLLTQGGYSGTTETIGVDSAGYIREITATAKYADGSSSIRHSILSNFGCAPKLYAPDEDAPPVTTTVPCAPTPSATTTTTPSTTTAPTTVAPTTPPTTSEAPSTSTTGVPITEPPTSTSAP